MTVIENNPTNVSSAFEMPLEEIEIEINFVSSVQTHSRQNRCGSGAALRLHGHGTRLHYQLRHQVPHGARQ